MIIPNAQTRVKNKLALKKLSVKKYVRLFTQINACMDYLTGFSRILCCEKIYTGLFKW